MSRSYELALSVVGTVKRYAAATIQRLHAIINTQLPGALEGRGEGILVSRYGDTSFQVTAGTGLQVLVAPGAGIIQGDSAPTCYIERATQLPLVVPASSTCYVWQSIEQRTTPARNFTEETALPYTFISTNAAEPNAFPLASFTSTGSSVGAITDLRGLPIDRVDPEQVRDAVAAAFQDSNTLDFTDNDAGNTFTAEVLDNAISNAKLRDSAGLSVIGRSANATGDPADIVAATDGHVLRRSGTTIGFGTLAAGALPAGAPVIVSVAAAAAIATTTDVQKVDTASANIQTLPASAGNRWGFVVVKNIQTSAGLSFAAASGTSLEAGVPILTSAGASLSFFLDGTVWRLM